MVGVTCLLVMVRKMLDVLEEKFVSVASSCALYYYLMHYSKHLLLLQHCYDVSLQHVPYSFYLNSIVVVIMFCVALHVRFSSTATILLVSLVLATNPSLHTHAHMMIV